MKVVQFTGQKIYGYIDIDIRPKRDITFLTGINGCGKTTAINCISSLLTPNIQYLCSIEFVSLSLAIEIGGEIQELFCSKTASGLILSCSNIDEYLEITGYSPSQDSPFSLQDEEDAYYRAVLAKNRQSPVISLISSLPTPMYLGLNRRASIDDRSLDLRINRPYPRYSSLHERAPYSSTLEEGFHDAIELAESDAYRTEFAVSSLNTAFQQQILRELLQFEPLDLSNNLRFPNKRDINQLSDIEQKIAKLSQVQGFGDIPLEANLRPLIERLKIAAKNLSKYKQKLNEEKNEKISVPNEISHQLLFWQFNQQSFRKILNISHIFDDYAKERGEIRSKNDNYIGLINRFLSGSGKSVSFGGDGKVEFLAKVKQNTQTINNLSSGEMQVFVLLTHLYFNPAVQRGNLVIIDEPELSLHVQWQEIFVDSLLDASDDVQFLLATHSPSIILDRIEQCIELSGE